VERNVVTLETGKKLKELGFPQTETMFEYWQDMAEAWQPIRLAVVHPIRPVIAAPTAQEIADELPNMWNMWTNAFETDPDLQQQYSVEGSLGGWANADTMAEALAALWLAITGEPNQ
jgi:hypothetical protein